MVLMNIKTDRGIELNKRRLREEFTDISLVIEGHKFPAHRMIGNFFYHWRICNLGLGVKTQFLLFSFYAQWLSEDFDKRKFRVFGKVRNWQIRNLSSNVYLSFYNFSDVITNMSSMESKRSAFPVSWSTFTLEPFQ